MNLMVLMAQVAEVWLALVLTRVVLGRCNFAFGHCLWSLTRCNCHLGDIRNFFFCLSILGCPNVQVAERFALVLTLVVLGRCNFAFGHHLWSLTRCNCHFGEIQNFFLAYESYVSQVYRLPNIWLLYSHRLY